MPANRATVCSGDSPQRSRLSSRRRGRSHSSKRSRSMAMRTMRQIGRVELVVVLEMMAHHLADGDDEQRLALILMAVQSQKRAMGGVDELDQPNQATRQRTAVLEEIMIDRGGVEAALRIKHIESGDLVETDADLMMGRRECAAAEGSEEPRPQKTRHTRHTHAMDVERRRQGRGVPAPRIQVDIVTIGHQVAARGRQCRSRIPRDAATRFHNKMRCSCRFGPLPGEDRSPSVFAPQSRPIRAASAIISYGNRRAGYLLSRVEGQDHFLRRVTTMLAHLSSLACSVHCGGDSDAI